MLLCDYALNALPRQSVKAVPPGAESWCRDTSFSGKCLPVQFQEFGPAWWHAHVSEWPCRGTFTKLYNCSKQRHAYQTLQCLVSVPLQDLNPTLYNVSKPELSVNCAVTILQLVAHAWRPSSHLEGMIEAGKKLLDLDHRFLLALHIRRGINLNPKLETLSTFGEVSTIMYPRISHSTAILIRFLCPFFAFSKINSGYPNLDEPL